ncbi:MAG: hypothetical protein LAT63_17060 [Marinobacter sp.]|nr:hypothetical protein [Marinobacter sp.]
MKTVHKYRLDGSGKIDSFKVREGYRIVHSEYVVTEKAVFVWLEVPLDLSVPETDLKLRIFRTGEAIPRAYVHLATAVDAFGPEAYHVYRVDADTTQLKKSA